MIYLIYKHSSIVYSEDTFQYKHVIFRIALHLGDMTLQILTCMRRDITWEGPSAFRVSSHHQLLKGFHALVNIYLKKFKLTII